MATLPNLGASSTNIWSAGYSAGGFMTAQLMTVWPDLIRCGGMLNGGFTNTQMARKNEYSSATTEEQHEANYQETVRLLGAWATAEDIGDQSLLSNNAMYIFSGANDVVVPPISTLEAKRYFEEQGATVSYTLDQEQGHSYNESTAAGDIGAFCNTSLELGVTQNSYTYEAGSSTFTSSGTWRRFDQQVFAAANGIDDTRELRQWGFYYIPSGCTAENSCQFQLVMHGAGMQAEQMGPIFGPYAEANNVVMVFPQGVTGWNTEPGTIASEPTDDNQYTKTGRINRFMNAIIATATSTRGADLADTLAAGVYTWGEAYPEGTWGGAKAGGDDKEGGGDEDWTYADGVWTNSSTGETWAGDKSDGEKNPGDKEGWGDKDGGEKDGGEKDGGEKDGWDPKDWAEKDWGSKDGKDDVSKDGKDAVSKDEKEEAAASGALNGTCDLEGVERACNAGLCCGTYEGKEGEFCGKGVDDHTCSAFKLMASVGSVLAAAYLL